MKLAGKRVAFTGQLASMTRAEAVELVRAHGGTFVGSVSRQTSYLVVGQEGWPLRKDGGLSGKLEMAKVLLSSGSKIAILSEEELFERLGLEGASSGVHKRFTLAQLGRLLNVPRNRLKAWMRCRLLEPLEIVQGVCYFDFQQVTGIRTLWNLTQAGVKTETIRRSLERLTSWIPSLDTCLAQLRLIEQNGQVLVRLGDGQLAEPSGQLRLDFDVQAESVTTTSAAEVSAAGCWEKGCAFEEAGQLEEAAHAYREALYVGGPDARVCFNLANVLYTLGHLGQAAERYRQTIEIDHNHAEAWNNLGNLLVEFGQQDDALDAYRHALNASPEFADAHYNLADALEQAERFSEARRHWKEYLRREPAGEWADYARRRLAN